MKLKISDLRRRMDGRDAIVRLRNLLETSYGQQLEELVDGIEALAGPPAPPPNSDVLAFTDKRGAGGL